MKELLVAKDKRKSKVIATAGAGRRRSLKGSRVESDQTTTSESIGIF